jgi:hypothetical protein
MGGHGILQVCGIGGVGKTQLVLEYCHRHSSTYNSVFWISASNMFSLHRSMFNIVRQIQDFWDGLDQAFDQDLHSVLQALGLEDTSVDDTGFQATLESRKLLASAIRDWLLLEGNNNWLLVIDDADDPNMFNVNEFFNRPPPGTVLITARSSTPMPDQLDSAAGINLSGLEDQDSITLLHISLMDFHVSYKKSG